MKKYYKVPKPQPNTVIKKLSDAEFSALCVEACVNEIEARMMMLLRGKFTFKREIKYDKEETRSS